MSRSAGDIAEDRACGYLRRNGFDIIDRNVHSRFGEIDIIALKAEVLHFVEVKSALRYEGAVQNITPKKMQRIVKTAQTYMQKHRLTLHYSFDAILVTSDEIHYLENITL